jgi:hypothetical protein
MEFITILIGVLIDALFVVAIFYFMRVFMPISGRDKATRKAIQELGKIAGHSSITYYDNSGDSLVFQTPEEIQEQVKGIFKEKPVFTDEQFLELSLKVQRIYDHVGVEEVKTPAKVELKKKKKRA